MSYVEAGAPSDARRARRRRALITLGLVALMLFFAFWYAYSYYRSDNTRRAAPRPVCTTAATAPQPADVTVNVYNATTRDGLAKKTAAEVRKRGFLVATVSNDPLQKKVTGPAEVRYGPSGKKEAALVLQLVKGAKGVQDARNDSSVDLVLGATYKALAPPVKQVPTSTATKGATPTKGGTATPSTAC
ncbi:LytR C-terminal domain-containing protein [Pedococcus sp. NPDC057267]|uniref:LytR C-terminal domain-containing protein n=1 Tax=Pedococcus sp. NPDC057267 TaxID=3346077 RepID=UPI00362C86A5